MQISGNSGGNVAKWASANECVAKVQTLRLLRVFRHWIRLTPNDILAHPPASVLQRDGQAVWHHDKILRLRTQLRHHIWLRKRASAA